MRVTIEHTTMKFGLFKTVPAIALTVEFSDLEKAVIQKAGLGDYEVFTPNYYSGLNEAAGGPVYVRYLLRGTRKFPYDDLAAARADEVTLKDALKNLKDAIEANSQPHETKTTFEL